MSLQRVLSCGNARTQFGFIVGYVLFGLALVSLVTGAIISMNKNNGDQQLIAQRRQQIIDDAITIRNALINCAHSYPNGWNTDAQAAYPQFPEQASDGGVSNLVCPGAPADPLAGKITMWTSLTRSGSVVSAAPPRRIGMQDWKYVNKLVGGTPQLYIYLEPNSAADRVSAGIVQSLNKNWKLKDDFNLELITRSTGEIVPRLQSRNLSNGQ